MSGGTRVTKWPMTDFLSYEQKATIVNSLVDTLFWMSPQINPLAGTIEPPSDVVTDGFIALADGSGWDPAGDGTKGLFRWNGAAWVYVG